MSDAKNGRLRIVVDGDDVARLRHASEMMAGAADPASHIQFRSDRAPGLPNLALPLDPTEVYSHTARRDPGVQMIGQSPKGSKTFRAAEPAPTCHQAVSVADIDRTRVRWDRRLDGDGLVRRRGLAWLDVSRTPWDR